MSDLLLPQNRPEAPFERVSYRREGERRVITMLFCDVTGSTEMAEQLDPEEWAEIMDGAFDYLIQPIRRYEGTVARLMGDGMLAFFGAPVAHEDDPQRAVLAGLDIIKGIRAFCKQVKREYGLNFSVRVGINTGPVVVGEIGTEQAFEYTAMGDAINLAARMEQTALPGTIQISEETYKMVAPLFDVYEVGPVEIKGKAEPVRAYRVLGLLPRPTRRRGVKGLNAPLVGRAQEFERLRAVIEDVWQGRGHIVCLVGEAGLGKSRLIEELRVIWEERATDEHSWLESWGVSYDPARPYGIFRQFLDQLYGIMEDDALETARDKMLRHAGSGSQEGAQVAANMADAIINLWAALQTSGGQPPSAGEVLKRAMHESILKYWRHAASIRPYTFVFDDLHWADSASAELLQYLLPLVEEVPMLFVFAGRPYQSSVAWRVKETAAANHPQHYTEICLNPLTPEESSALIDSLLGTPDLPEPLPELILRKTDGNPFFVEEVVRSLIESGVVRQDESGVWRADAEVEDINIPDNLQALLLARLDRLPEEARHTLQLASVIGNPFDYRVLWQVIGATESIDQQLAILKQAELIDEVVRPPEPAYTFRNKLMRDATYHSILKRHRREFHRLVGEAIESLLPDRLEKEAHRLAHHFYEAQDHGKALKYYTMAGDAAVRVYANTEAIAHYMCALEIAPLANADSAQWIHLYTSLGRTQELCGQYDEALVTYEQLEALAHAENNPALELAAILPQATVYSTFNVKFDPQRGRELAERALSLARKLHDQRAEARAFWNMALLEGYFIYDLERAVQHGEQSLAIARRHNLREQMAYTLNDLGNAYSGQGRWEQAFAALEEARALWQELNNLPMLTDNLSLAAYSKYLVGQFDEGLELAEEAMRISESIDNPWGQAYSRYAAGLIHLERGEFDRAITLLEESLPLSEQASFAMPQVIARAVLALAHELLGDSEAANTFLQEALTRSEVLNVNAEWVPMILAKIHFDHGDLRAASAALVEVGDSTREAYDAKANGLPIADLIRAEIMLAQAQHEQALTITTEVVASLGTMGIQPFLADVLWFQGQALLGLGRADEARQALLAAHQQAQKLQARRCWWRILATFKELEAAQGHREEASALHRQAREIVYFIADHAGTPQRRACFLGQPDVRALLDG